MTPSERIQKLPRKDFFLKWMWKRSNSVKNCFELQNEPRWAVDSFTGVLDRYRPKSTKGPFLIQNVAISEICSDLSQIYFSLSNTWKGIYITENCSVPQNKPYLENIGVYGILVQKVTISERSIELPRKDLFSKTSMKWLKCCRKNFFEKKLAT